MALVIHLARGSIHGSHVDSHGNVWVTDVNIEKTILGMPTEGRGNRVYRFSPSGRLLMTLGTRQQPGNGPTDFDMPTDVVTSPNGNIFVTDGHGTNDRVVKFAPDGRFIKTWGTHGSAPGQFDQPHTIAIDGRGRLFVGDRSNNRIQIFDQDGNFITEWRQFGRPSGIAIGPDDRIYVTDSMSSTATNPGHKRGIFIGSALTGEMTDFIPDP